MRGGRYRTRTYDLVRVKHSRQRTHGDWRGIPAEFWTWQDCRRPERCPNRHQTATTNLPCVVGEPCGRIERQRRCDVRYPLPWGKVPSSADDRQARPTVRPLHQRPAIINGGVAAQSEADDGPLSAMRPIHSACSAWTRLRIPTTRASAASSVARSWTVVADMRCS